MANALNRPAAGALGLFVLPTRGIRASVRASLGQQLDPHSVLRGPREALTRQAMSDLAEGPRRQLLGTFTVLEGETKDRQKKLKKIQWLLIADKRARAEEKIKRQREYTEKAQRKEAKRALLEQQRSDGPGAEIPSQGDRPEGKEGVEDGPRREI